MYHLKSLSKQRKQIGSVWLFFLVSMLEFPYRPIYWQALLLIYHIGLHQVAPLGVVFLFSWLIGGLKNINVFYSTFTNGFFIFVTFLTFLTFFFNFFSGTFFTSMPKTVLWPDAYYARVRGTSKWWWWWWWWWWQVYVTYRRPGSTLLLVVRVTHYYSEFLLLFLSLCRPDFVCLSSELRGAYTLHTWYGMV